MKKLLIIFMATLFGLGLIVGVGKAYQDEDRIRPTPDPKSKYKVYVPKDLEEAFAELKKMLSSKVLNEMKAKPEDGMADYHFGLGMWMRNNWGLWGESRLAKYFNSISINHPDDMSGIILGTFWCHLNDKPLQLERRVERAKQYWLAMQEPKNRRCPQDNSVIEMSPSKDVKSDNERTRVIHHGICKKNGHSLDYEYDKGWYDPSERN